MGHHPAGRTSRHHRPAGLHLHPKPALGALDTSDMEPDKTNEDVATLAVTTVNTATGRKIGHRRGPQNQVVW
jgi:hypothetical protein